MFRRVNRRFLTEQQTQEYQQFLLTNPSDDQQLEYFRNNFEILSAQHILDLFRILNSRSHPQEIQILRINRYLRNLFAQQPQVNHNMAQVPVASVEEFIDDPFHGNINPGTKTGAQLYLKATAVTKEEDKFDLNMSSAQKFLDLMTQDADAFGWGGLVRAVPTEPNIEKDLLVEHKLVTSAQIKKQAHITWQDHAYAGPPDQVPDDQNVSVLDPTNDQAHRVSFYRRVKSRMIAKRILGRLKAADYKILKNKETQYKWTGNDKVEYDGPTILWILLQSCNPSTRVGVSELKSDLRTATSAKFKHNVKDLTDYMSSKFREIREKGQQHHDYLLDLFNALETVPNDNFTCFVRKERQAWEIGGKKEADQLIAEAMTIYNNAVSSNRWEYSDPKDAKIIALSTKLEELEKQVNLSAHSTQSQQSNSKSNDNKSGGNNSKYLTIEDWRMKKGEQTVERDGKTWHWCPKPVSPGRNDGLYVTHKPEDHEEWAKNRNRFKKNKKDDEKKEDKDNESSTKSNDKSLALSNSLKAALLTRCDLTAAHADALIMEAKEEADF